MRANIFYIPMGQGEPVVVLHGGPGLDHTYLFPYLSPLAQSHELIFYDQRGSGQSECQVVSTETTLNRFILDLDALRRGLNLDRIHLLGHGWGAFLAQRYAYRHPDRTKSLILLNPMPSTWSEFQVCLRLAITHRPAEEQEKLAQMAVSEGVLQGKTASINAYFSLWFHPFVGKDKLQLAFGDYTAKNSLLVSNLMLDHLGENYTFCQEEESLVTPALVIAGDLDFIPIQQVQALSSRLQNGRLVVLPGVGHFPFIEAPQPLFSAIQTFLEKSFL